MTRTRSARWTAALLLLGLALPRPARAESVQLLADPRESLCARTELVDGAATEVLIQSFIFGDDRLTLGTLAQLRAAARRGVSVKLLVDAWFNAIPAPVQAHLVAEGVELREYHPFRLHRLHWSARRMHDKTLVVDGAHLLLGGRNVQSPYFGDGAEVGRRDYLDTDVEIEGAVAGSARTYFLTLWTSGHVRKVSSAASRTELEAAARQLDEADTWLRQQLAEHPPAAPLQPALPVAASSIRFLHDVVGAKASQPGVAEGLLELVDASTESIVVESPYVVPGRRFRRAARAARERGVALSITTNSLATTDNLWPQAAYVGRRRAFVRNGIELFEYRGPESHHAKTAVIDGRTCVIGSFNLDPRSARLSTEVAVVIESEALAAELLAVTRARQAGCWRIGPDGRPHGETQRYPDVPRCKVWRLRLRRLLVPFVRRHV